jgi:threonine/homoserine/homoserine lactone efflux protein
MIVSNLAIAFGTLAETVELFLAIFMMIGGIILTWLVQRWADKTGEEQPAAANVGRGGTVQHENRTMRG